MHGEKSVVTVNRVACDVPEFRQVGSEGVLARRSDSFRIARPRRLDRADANDLLTLAHDREHLVPRKQSSR